MSRFLMLRWVVLLVCLLTAADTIAQQNFAQHNWYFGSANQGIRFSRSTAQPSLVTPKANPFGTGGSAVASNPINGDLFFYTDGNRIYDILHGNPTPMFNAPTLLPAPPTTNQPVVICPIPGAPNQYYIFTNSASFNTPGQISVITVDMSLSGNEEGNEPPIGRVTSTNLPTGIIDRSEGMIIVPDNTGTNFWLITHENGADIFTATLIDGSGDFSSVTVTNPSDPNLTGFDMSVANFSYHAATGKLAVSPQTANRNVAILDFDNTTGDITFDRHVLTSGAPSTTNQAIYDTEWSPSGRFLYISIHGESAAPGIQAAVFQFDMDTPGASLVNILDGPGPVFRSFGLKIAPDTAIYHLYQTVLNGPFLVGRITDTDSVGVATVYTPDVFGFNFNGRQFPEFLPPANNNLAVSFKVQGICANSPSTFFPKVVPAADSLRWEFGDPGATTASDWSPVHIYETGGPVTVRVTAFLNGQAAVKDSTFNITVFNLQVRLVQDTTACRCEFPAPVGNSCNDGPFTVTATAEGGGTPSFIWSNGDTGADLTPDSAGYYYVRVTDGTPNCVAYAGVNIREYDAEDQRANIWYFGTRAGIDFNEQPPAAIAGPQGPPPFDTPEGCSVISDRNGEVVFSTDGVHVYDRNDQLIVNALNIPIEIGGENGSTQSALIIPVPGDETLYYIFTTQQVHGSNTYELRYSLYDIKLRTPAGPGNFTNGDGGLVTFNQLLFSRSTERISGNENWLIAHEYGNNSFRAYQISTTGISNPIISSLGSDHRVTEELNGQGYMELTGNLLAVALSNSPTQNFIELFDFTDSTGVVSNFRSLDLQTTDGQVYGVEIRGNKILTTVKGASNSYLREAYINYLDQPILIPPDNQSTFQNTQLGAIQVGPNGTVYVAVDGANSIATVAVNADTLQLSRLTFNAQPVAGTSRLGLPNFIQQIFTGTPDPTISITALCFGTPSRFAATGTDAIDEFRWDFGDGATSTSRDTTHLYPGPGNYFVTLQITNRCGLDTTLTQHITIVGPPPNPTFVPAGQQATVCNGPITLQALPANNPDFTYLWSTGATTFSIQVDRQQIVSVTITNSAGCTSSGEILVADNRPIIDLGPDQTVCEGASVPNFNLNNQSLDYVWTINGVNQGNNSPVQAVDTSTPTGNPDSDIYRVTATNSGNGCVGQDEVTITIYPTPVINLTPTNASGCGAMDGQLQLSITGPTGSAFSYEVFSAPSTPVGSDDDRTPVPVNVNFTGLGAGTYTAIVEDQLSGCSTTRSAGINSSTVTVTGTAATPTCTAVPINVTATVSSGSYRVINTATGQVEDANTFNSASFATAVVPVPGNYIVEITAGTCIATDEVPVNSGSQPDIDFVFDVCSEPMTIGISTAAPANSVYTWTNGTAGAGIVAINNPNTTAVPTVNNTTHTYTLRITNPSNPAQCEVTESIDIFVARNITATIAQDPTDGCDDPVTIRVTPSPIPGPYTYIWTRNPGGTFDGGSTIIATLADNGVEYTVIAQHARSGCVSPPVSHIAEVYGEAFIALDPDQVCGPGFSIEATFIVGATYQWFREGNPIPGTTSTITGLTLEGNYSAIATTGNGCPAEGSVRVLFPEPVIGGSPATAFICNRPGNRNCVDPDSEDCIVLLEAPDGAGWQWYRADFVPGDDNPPLSPSPIIGETSRTLVVTSPGWYYVDVEINECVTRHITKVKEQCDPYIEAPNAFRPGSDIITNKTFRIFPGFVSPDGFRIFIYNRWGELIYQSDDLDFRWDGTYRGNKTQLLPMGTYTYVIKFHGELTTGKEEELRGGVMLLR